VEFKNKKIIMNCSC